MALYSWRDISPTNIGPFTFPGVKPPVSSGLEQGSQSLVLTI